MRRGRWLESERNSSSRQKRNSKRTKLGRRDRSRSYAARCAQGAHSFDDQKACHRLMQRTEIRKFALFSGRVLPRMVFWEEVRIELPVSRRNRMRERVFVGPHDRVPSMYGECLWSEARAFDEDGVNDRLFHSDSGARGRAQQG